MNELLPPIEIALLMGLRHGLAPDHLAAVDGLTVRARSAAAPWMGTIFSLGHGAVMLVIVAASGLMSTWLQPGRSMFELLHAIEWLPGVLLLGLAALNARSLIWPSPSDNKSSAIHTRLTQGRTVSPIVAMGTGMLFALGVESALQAIAWGYAAMALGADVFAALKVAAAFVLGMTLIDSIDGYATARIASVAGGRAIQTFRRRLGWPVVALCTVSGVQLLMAKVCSNCKVEEDWMGVIAMCMVGVTVAVYSVTLVVSLFTSTSVRRPSS